MSKLRFGVLGCSEFAGRAMMPAMKALPELDLRAVASRALEQARVRAQRFGCEAVEGYERLLERDDIDAVYVPLPPALHEVWVERALDAGKHVLVEKPFVAEESAAQRLVAKARSGRKLIIENILFPHHSQFNWVREKLAAGVVGELRLLRSAFTIPPLAPGNFRYQASLGGGALLDQGPYMVRLARAFLGESLRLSGAAIREDRQRGLDLGGTLQFVNPQGVAAQLAYGFETHYQCSWEFLGAQGRLLTDRGYTAPPGFTPTMRLERQNHREEFVLPADDHYRNLCGHFARTVQSGDFEPSYSDLIAQAKYLGQIAASATRFVTS